VFLATILRIILITVIFITTYLPITINPKIFERNPGDSVSYITADNVTSAIDY